jgi:two-component system OmpR family response regulator
LRILVVDGDESAAERWRAGLVREGYAVDIALTGEDGEEMAEAIRYDLLILYIILPGKSGPDVCQSLRRKQIPTLILMLTDMNTPEDQLRVLNFGADDYLTKPFVFAVLLARVRALLRRAPFITLPQLKIGDLVMDTLTREVRYKDAPVDVFGKRYSILEVLMRHSAIVVRRRFLEENCWDFTMDAKSNVLEAHISILRATFAARGLKKLIQTVRGVGYRLNIHNILYGSALSCLTIFLLCLLSSCQFQLDWFSFLVGGDS